MISLIAIYLDEPNSLSLLDIDVSLFFLLSKFFLLADINVVLIIKYLR